MNSSINDFDDYIPVYGVSQYKHNKSAAKVKDVQNDDGVRASKNSKSDSNEAEKIIASQCRKDLVKIQKINKIKQLREQREKEKLEEERKKQNLEALNNLFKKKHENYKRKKDVKNQNDSLEIDEDDIPHQERLTVKPNIQSQDNIKFSHLTANKLGTKPNTSKNSTVGSVTNSIQSPLSRRIYVNEDKRNKKSSIGDESTNASNFHNIPGRMTYEPRFQNKRGSVGSSTNTLKQIKKINKSNKGSNLKKSQENGSKQSKKIISIPSVQIDKRAVKMNKKANYCDIMDTIPENQDFSENDANSVYHHPLSTKSKTSKKTESGGRKIIMSKINKVQNQDQISKYPNSEHKIEKVKTKKIKKSKTKPKTNKGSHEKPLKYRSDAENFQMKSIEVVPQVNSSMQADFQRQSMNTEEVNYSQSYQKQKKDSSRFPTQNIIHGEFEYDPNQNMQEQILSKESHNYKRVLEMATPLRDEWDVEMFSSKKFSDIMAKHKKSRYEQFAEKDDSYIDFQAPEHDAMQVIDIFDDNDVLDSQSGQKKSSYISPNSDAYDNRIKKVEVNAKNETNKSRELMFEDLALSSQHTNKSIKKSQVDKSFSKMSNDKVFTTSINLMDYDLLPEKKLPDADLGNSKTHDMRDEDDSLTKPPNWNFISSNRLKSSSNNKSQAKNVFVDEFDELKSESQNNSIHNTNSPNFNNEVNISEQLYKDDGSYSNSLNNESGGKDYIDEALNNSQDQCHENISVFDEEENDQYDQNNSVIEHNSQDSQNGENNIPFNLDDENNEYNNDYHSNNDEFEHEDQSHIEEPDTLKQLRIMFGSEQKIREQSQQAIQQFNTDESEKEHSPEREQIQTPNVLSQSMHEMNKTAHANSNVFDRKSFQEFSMKKFQELMFENKMSDFIDSVERSVRQNTAERDPHNESRHKADHSNTPKRSHYISPRKVSRKELELDRIAGSHMKYMSEKKLRRSMLDQSDSVILQNSGKDLLNKSLDLHKLRTGTDSSIKVPFEIINDKEISQTNHKTESHLINKMEKLQYDYIEKTEKITIRDQLIADSYDDRDDSIRRSDVRGLDMLISEKSNTSVISKESPSSIRHSEETQTLKYDTEERYQHTDSAHHIRQQKDMMYSQLHKIMDKCFIEDKDGKTQIPISNKDLILPHDDVSSLSSKHYESKQDSLNYLSKNTMDIENSEKSKYNADDLITPREHPSASQVNMYCYRTPTSEVIHEQQKNYNANNFQTIGSYETDRREDVFSHQFYSNKDSIPRREDGDENTHIYVDQWDDMGDRTKFEDLSSSDPYNPNESIGIHTAKNSPLESAQKDRDYEAPSSEKYTVTEESAEKHLSDLKNQKA